MQTAPLPPNEPARLEAVRRTGLLDTLPEEAYDDFTRLVAFVCDVPMALVTIVDERRQWFKSRVGLDVPETPRDVAFCAHAILGEETFVVPDAKKDERFHDNPLVEGSPHIRFYAGVPLVLPDGNAIGTLCALDQKPRDLTPGQLDALRALGRQLVSLVQLRQARARLAETQRQLESDLDAAAHLQRMLIPDHQLRVPGLDVAWRFEPSHSIGGDIFNLVRLGPGRVGAYILDVSGHGVPSALVTFSVAQSLSAAQAMTSAATVPAGLWSDSPREVIEHLDRAFPFERFEKFFTMACLVLDVRTGALRSSCAGHPPPILVRPDGALQLLDKGGGLVGLGLGGLLDEEQLTVEPGDRLFLVTDGIAEAANPAGEHFGEARLYELLRACRGRTLAATCDEVLGTLHAFTRQPPTDDVSLLALEYRGPQSPE